MELCINCSKRGFRRQAVSSRVYVWDYRGNFLDLGFISPYPDWASIVPNMKAFKAAGIKGYYAECDMTNLHGDLQELGMYINTMAAWDSDRWSYEELLQDFVPNYYSPVAAPYVYQYIELMTRYAAEYGLGDGRNNYLGANSASFAPFCTENGHFTKTGSGQM
jgi:hypothetical protein